MKEVTLKVADLLEKVRANRDAHRGLFENAIDGFRAKVISVLDQRLADARAGKVVNQYLGLVEPEDHTRDYDRVISMLEMSVDEKVTIDSQDFAKFAMDDWDWKRQFTDSCSHYVS